MAPGTSPMSEAIDGKKISRRSIVAGIAALCVHGLARKVRAAETRPLAERLATYAAALRYQDLDAATIERVKSHVIDTLGCGIAAFDERPVRICREIAQNVQGAATIIGTTRKTSPDLAAFADGEASRNAVFAAMLARGGLSGPAPIFEGRLGLFKQVSGEANIDVGEFGGRGNPFRINRCGMKAYPAVVYTQTGIVAATAVADEVTKGAPVGYDRAAALERIASIEIATSRRGLQQTGSESEKWAPATRDNSDHSMPYITARAMFDGDITNDSYAPAKLKEPRILAFMQKITVAEDPELTARVGDAVPTRITAILADGQRISREVNDIPGFAGKPMQRPDIDRKFRGNIGKRWPRRKTDGVLESLWVLEKTQDIGALLATLTV